jgi:hypothetical protein
MQHGNVKIKTYRITAVASVLYGCETWILTLREEHRLRIFENAALRNIYLHKTKKITWDWRKLYSAELRNEMGRVCAMYVREGRCIQGFVGEARRKKTIWKT